MQSSIGQYSTQAGEPAQPVQHSVMTANSLGFLRRTVSVPTDLGSNFSSSGTIPTALASDIYGRDYTSELTAQIHHHRDTGARENFQIFPNWLHFLENFSASLCLCGR